MFPVVPSVRNRTDALGPIGVWSTTMDYLVVSLEGDFDIACREMLEWKLKPAHFAPGAIVDLTNVGYMDSTCLNALVRMHKARAEKRYRPEVLVIPTPNIRRLFQVAGLDQLWDIYETLDEAAEALSDLPA